MTIHQLLAIVHHPRNDKGEIEPQYNEPPAAPLTYRQRFEIWWKHRGLNDAEIEMKFAEHQAAELKRIELTRQGFNGTDLEAKLAEFRTEQIRHRKRHGRL